MALTVKDRPLEAQRKERIANMVIMAKKLIANKVRREVILNKLKKRAKKDYMLSDNSARDYANSAIEIALSD